MKKIVLSRLFIFSLSLTVLAGQAMAQMTSLDRRYFQGQEAINRMQLRSQRLESKLTNVRTDLEERRRLRRPITPEMAGLEEGLEMKIKELYSRIEALEQKLHDKRAALSMAAVNQRNLGKAMSGHTKIYPFKGPYHVLVIPVQFSDAKFKRPDFFETNMQGKNPAQEFLFGNDPGTLSSFYRHQSLGKFHLSGIVTAPVTVEKSLDYYGEAIATSSDAHARELAADALSIFKDTVKDESFWDDFDRWDLSDYDQDGNYHEPDGFIDAVIFVYAGKSQASCQSAFDPEGKRPATRDVPAGPRHDATVECFNRIWPHRWMISLTPQDPRFSALGPVVEGLQRPSMNGLKIHNGLFALDYNMQSEFSDRSTFMHEFGHSLSLPDVYSKGEANSTALWELMSNNAHLEAQELSSYSRLSLGWLMPKIIVQGEKTSAYLGHLNFVSEKQRDQATRYQGPELSVETLLDKTFNFSIVSKVPEYEESVYRALAVLPKPQLVKNKVITPPENTGHYLAYSGRYDGQTRGLKFRLKVPENGNQVLSFDTLYSIETETNFDSTDPQDQNIKVTVDYDLGRVLVDGKVVEELRLISGDENFDTLAEKNPACAVSRVLELRTKRLQGTVTPEELSEFNTLLKVCRSPQWVQKKYDLKELAGKTVEVEIHLETDGGYTELGLLVDNISLGEEKITFENGDTDLAQGFVLLNDGTHQEHFHQFYLMEYRDPKTNFVLGKKRLSFNMDRNIQEGTQAMFVGEGTPLEKFRLVTFDYRPGVLVWYYNSRFNRVQNDPRAQDGKGYLLVLNSKVQELPLPSILGSKDLFDEFGNYRRKDEVYKNLVTTQREAFTCFSHTEYATYLTGTRPNCQGRENIDLMPTLSLDGKNLIYRRINFNELLHHEQQKNMEVGEPMRNSVFLRTGLSVFVPEGTAEFNPFKVYKAQDSKLILDTDLTNAAPRFASVSSFRDSDNRLATFQEFQGDSVVVEKTGLKFKVTLPGPQVTSKYSTKVKGEDNAHYFRRPQAKIYIDWE